MERQLFKLKNMKTATTVRVFNDGFKIGDRVYVDSNASDVKTGTVYGKWGNFGIDVLFDDRPSQTFVVNLMHEKAHVI
jgi:hypothetical protein